MNGNNTAHLPGLNGLRAIAAISVVWGHCFQNTFGNWGIKGIKIPINIDGVTLFFVISGFLITFLLLKERDEVKTINIPKFYMRRILRIWPLYFGYILIAALTLYICYSEKIFYGNTIWYYAFFAANIPFILAIAPWVIVHYWSLGVEEQFYLFWPWIIKKCKKRKLLYTTIALWCCWLICKWGSLILGGKCIFYRFFSTTRFDCMMIGAIGAILFHEKRTWYINLTTNKIIDTLAWTAVILSNIYMDLIPAPIRHQFVSIVSLVLIMNQVCKKSIINLENHFFDHIGRISFGIYVIHPLIIHLLSKLYSSYNFAGSAIVQCIIIYLGITLITIGVATLCYFFYEKPFLNLKRKFAVIDSRDSMLNPHKL